MSDRTLIPTFVFWAFLTIITPTLILLSENSDANLDLNGSITEAMKMRRMIGHTENYIIRTPPPPAKSVVEEELAPAPAPAPGSIPLPLPSPSSSAPTGSHSHHNHTLLSNRTVTDDGLRSPLPMLNKEMPDRQVLE